MVLREFHLKVFEDYVIPKDISENYEHNYMFEINGYSEQINYAFIAHYRGVGEDLLSALFNAYDKITNVFKNKHHVHITELYAENIYKLKKDDKDEGTGHAFYPLTDEVRETFRKHELENSLNKN